jgi:hypothetical protein
MTKDSDRWKEAIHEANRFVRYAEEALVEILREEKNRRENVSFWYGSQKLRRRAQRAAMDAKLSLTGLQLRS